jgi:hypothetical protein
MTEKGYAFKKINLAKIQKKKRKQTIEIESENQEN